ncbi:MAG: hypothetical protein VCD50_14770 [Alphaproteobacteria bacterium]
MKADAMLDKGDLDGAAVWRQIVAAVRGLRDDVSVAIQLGRLQMTQQIIESAIPNLGSPKAPLTGLDLLAGMAMVMGELNDSIFAETGMPDVGRTTMSGYRPPAPETIVPLDQKPIMH